MSAQRSQDADIDYGSDPGAQVYGHAFSGFGTSIGIWTTEPALLAQLDASVRAWVDRVSAACSRFDETSDISRANQATGLAVRVSQELRGAFQAASCMALLTDGLYDPAVGTAVVNAGYDRTFESVAAQGPGPKGPRQLGGAWRRVELDHRASTMRVPEGYRLDLGGSAKGWAVDVALEGVRGSLLMDHPDAGVCISAGGDMAVAGKAPAGGWPVRISERLDRTGTLDEGEVHLLRGAIATSGATARSWRHGNEVGHHIVDPRTGRPGSSRWALVTVLADTCLVADTFATAAWLLDGDAVDWLSSWGVGARLMDQDGGVVLVGDLKNWLAGELPR
jgi:thiamine biosynthesis lipoprotein